jgi:hypothetical protein
MIVDIVLGIAVIALGISHILLHLAVRQLVEARRPVDLLERKRRATLILTTHPNGRADMCVGGEEEP